MTSGGSPSFEIPDIDFVALAASFKMRGARVSRAVDFPALLAEAITSGEPMLLDVPVDTSIQQLR
jgi:thiamine pyrophosphate-dependent acetolactate synthase large subunit-like protein